MRYLWTVLSVVLLGGCIPYSDNPLTVLETECMDSAVLGTWFVHNNDETVFVHIGKDRASKGLCLTMVEFDRDGEVKTSELTGHTSQLGDKRYLNLRWVQPVEKAKGYLFVKYTVDEKHFGISIIKAGPIEKSIQEGRLKGEITQGKWTSSIRLMEPSEGLRDFFKNNDNDLFEELIYMNRLDLPEAGGETAELQTGEVLVVQKPENAETIYSISDEVCELQLTTHQSEVDRGVVHVRSECYVSFERKMVLFQKVLTKVMEDEKPAHSFDTLYWGRLAPNLSVGPQEMSFRLALAAYQSPLWDTKRGRPKKGRENYFVVELANKAEIFRELNDVFATFNRSVRFSRVEKVLIMEAEKFPFFEALKKHGIQAEDRLPFDCITWFFVSSSK